MSNLNRRSFLQTGLAGALVAVSGTKASGRIVGANGDIRLAVCGLNGRGGDHIKEFGKIPGVRITHLVDPDTRTHEKRIKQVTDLKQPAPTAVQDIRKVLEDRNVDAISIATPNHWHALMTIWACQAGKDVYVEKPVSHNPFEGRIAVETAKKTGRIVQHGTQRRSWKNYQALAEIVHSGHYGPLRVSRGLVYKNRLSIGEKPVGTPPSEVDYNLWTGPAPMHPFHTNLVHYNWHWFWDFGNGDIGNQGVHQMDIARWMIPNATLPKSVISLGGRFGYKDQGETPNTQLTVYDFGATKLIFEVRGLATKDYPGDTKNEGSVLHFDGGHITGFKFYPNGKTDGEELPKIEPKLAKKPAGNNIFQNFVAAVRSRKADDLVAPVLEGHYSSMLIHLGNASYRLGSQVPFRPTMQLPNADAAVKETLAATEEHLARSGGVTLETAKVQLGKMLTIDAGNESVMGDPAANALLTRKYRAPFVVPASV